MKAVFFILLIAFNQSAWSQGAVAGGGGTYSDADKAIAHAKYMEIINKIGRFFAGYESLDYEFPELNFKKLEALIPQIKLDIVEDSNLTDKNNVSGRTCLNYPELKFIRCDIASLEKMKENTALQYVMTYHEILGLLGVEESSPKNPSIIDDYKYSKKIAQYATNRGQSYLSVNRSEKTTEAYKNWFEFLKDTKRVFILKGDLVPGTRYGAQLFWMLLYFQGNGKCILIDNGMTIERHEIECTYTKKRLKLGKILKTKHCPQAQMTQQFTPDYYSDIDLEPKYSDALKTTYRPLFKVDEGQEAVIELFRPRMHDIADFKCEGDWYNFSN